MNRKAALTQSSQPPERRLPVLLVPATALIFLLLATAIALVITLTSVSSAAEFWLHFGLTCLAVHGVTLPSLLIVGGLQRVADEKAVLSALILVPVLLAAVLSAWLSSVGVFGEVQASWWSVLAWSASAGVISSVLARYLILQGRWRVQMAAESAARLESLQARIRPHFFFNTLNAIVELVQDRPVDAETAILDLSDLVRASFRKGASHTLTEELALIRGYLRIEQYRLGPRLQVHWHLSDDFPWGSEVPALLLQPVVENAVVHGIAQLQGGGELTISLRRSGRRMMEFEVINPVPGARSASKVGSQHGLENVRQRLDLAFPGEQARLSIKAEGGFFRACVRMPLLNPP